MDTPNWPAAEFETYRGHLRGVAYQMLGSASEADDAVQETWLRLSRADTGSIANLGGWLTTVVARICLDMLRARTARREEPLAPEMPEPVVSPDDAANPEHAAVLADSVGVALLVVLDTLSPAERLAFVLHDVFGVPFAEIAPIVGCTPVAARQLASRARRRVRGAGAASAADRPAPRAVVVAFLAAAQDGDFDSLLALLDPDAVLRPDAAAAAMGGPVEVRGGAAVAQFFAARQGGAVRPALVDGAPGAVWAPGRRPRVVFAFTIADGRIRAIDLLADPARLAALDVTILPA